MMMSACISMQFKNDSDMDMGQMDGVFITYCMCCYMTQRITNLDEMSKNDN